jgi:hypothetical protein
MFRNEVCSPDTLDGPITNTLIARGRPPQSLSRQQRLEPDERRIGGLHYRFPKAHFGDGRHCASRENLSNQKLLRMRGVMGRQDYYRRKAQELRAIATATRDPNAASWLRGCAVAYEKLARRAADNPTSLAA